MKIGYARVSTKHQRESLDQQIAQLKKAGCKEIYSELENLSLAKVLNDNNSQEISSMMNKYIDMGINNHQDIQDYFNLNTKQLRLIIDKVEEC